MNWPLFLRYFALAAWQIKWRLAALLSLTVAAAIVYAIVETPNYKTSWVMLLPGTERNTSLSLDNLGEARSNGHNAYGSVSISPKNTYKEIALSDAVISRAAADYGVETTAFSKPRIKLIDQTPAMEFTLKGSSKEDLAFRAKLYNDTFHTVLDELRTNEIERNYRGVEGSLSEAKRRLSEAREAVIAYQSEGSIVSDTQFQAWLNEAHEIRNQQGQAEVRMAALNAAVDAELAQLGITAEQAQAFQLAQANPTTQDAMQTLSKKLTEEASMQKTYGASNPLRKKLTKEIAGIRKNLAANLIMVPNLRQISRPQLYGLLALSMGEPLKQLNQQIAKLAGTQAEIATLDQLRISTVDRIKSHTKQAATLSDLKRDHQIAEAIFSSALAKLDTSRLDIYATYPLTQLLTQPAGTITRDRLQAKLMIVALFLACGLIGLSLVLIKLRSNLATDDQNSNLVSSDLIDSTEDQTDQHELSSQHDLSEKTEAS